MPTTKLSETAMSSTEHSSGMQSVGGPEIEAVPAMQLVEASQMETNMSNTESSSAQSVGGPAIMHEDGVGYLHALHEAVPAM